MYHTIQPIPAHPIHSQVSPSLPSHSPHAVAARMKALLGAAQPQASLVETPVVVMCVLRSEVMVCVWSKDKPGKVVELEAAWG